MNRAQSAGKLSGKRKRTGRHVLSTVQLSPLRRVSLPMELLRRFSINVNKRAPFVPWGIQRIQAPRAWKYATGKRVRVAVIDTGLDYSHRDLVHAARSGYNVLQPHLPPHDDNGHGTHIAGTIAARGSNSGMTGTAPDAEIYPVKAFDHQGTASISDIVAGIEWCIENRMDIINMSFGMRRDSLALREAVRRAHRAGIIIIASAGNDGKRRADYPACYPEVISVGATNRKRQVLSMSNRGEKIDIYAPGEKVMSTWPGGDYCVLSGTSMAAGYVSGAAALLLSMGSRLTPKQVKKILLQNTTPVSHAAGRAKTGELNVWAAVRSVLSARHIRSGADTPIKRRTLARTVRTQPTRARRA